MPVRFLLALALTCGILDATAVVNTGSFGIGAYIVASGIAGALIVARSFGLEGEESDDGVPSNLVNPLFLTIALLWLLATMQTSLQVSNEPMTLLTQTTVRTILIGHFLVCVLLMRIVGDQTFLHRLLCVILFVYISYGLYDLVAQVLHLPRFLNFLRNSDSAAITESVGKQGWIQLPRLMSLAAEPAGTLLPVALATFVFAGLRGSRRVLLLGMTFFFCIGTFARSVWIAMLGSACMALGFRIAAALWGKSSPKITHFVVTGAAVLLPVLIVSIPLLTTVPRGSDMSVVKRMDSSRASVSLFADHPVIGVGFQGWTGRALGFQDQLLGPPSVNYIHNGVGVYLAALGVAGIVIVYLPILLIMSARNLSLAAKGWWVGVYGFSALGSDYLALPSTWTAIAVAVCWVSASAAQPRPALSPP